MAVWKCGEIEGGQIGCGAVIKSCWPKTRITMSKLAVPFKVCTAMAGEIAGAAMLTGVFDLFQDKTSPIWKT